MKRLLLYAPTWERLRREIQALPEHELVIFGKDGRLRLEDGSIAPSEANVDFTWLNAELYQSELRPVFTDLLLSGQPKEWVHSSMAGMDFWVVPELMNRGLRVTVSHIQAAGISEYVLNGVLTHWQREAERREIQRRRQWEQLLFREVAGSTWLIIGFGSIGQAVAERARAFGASIVGVRRNQDHHPLADRIVNLAQIQELLPLADVVVLALPSNQSTRHLVDEKFLVQMKSGSILVNVGRGSLVAEKALIAALDRGVPDHTVLDAFDPEPLPPESPLWDHPRVALSCHCSAYSTGFAGRADARFLENARRFLLGEPLVGEVTLAMTTAGDYRKIDPGEKT